MFRAAFQSVKHGSEGGLEVTLVGQESTLVILITMCSTCQEKMKHKHVISVSLL